VEIRGTTAGAALFWAAKTANPASLLRRRPGFTIGKAPNVSVPAAFGALFSTAVRAELYAERRDGRRYIAEDCAHVNPLEILYNEIDEYTVNVFHAMKCRKAWRDLAKLEEKLW
jgi:hypothetical protein